MYTCLSVWVARSYQGVGSIRRYHLSTHLRTPPFDLLLSLGAGFNRRVSPTSFYPMMSGVATEARAASMMSGWLLNSSRFCVAPSGDFKGDSAISSLLQPHAPRLQP